MWRQVILDELARTRDNSGLKPEDVPANPALTFTLKNTQVIQGHPVILVQDIMVLKIIAANKFKRPIYFAVTVAGSNMLGLDNRRQRSKENRNFLRMDGLAFKVMPYPGPVDFLSQQRIHENLFEKFQYRNLNNPKVYLNRNIKGLLQNYRSAFLRLTNYYLFTEKDKSKALAVLDKMEEVMPESVIPLRDYQLSLSIGRMYADAGRPQELERRLDDILEKYPMQTMDKVMMAEFFRRELHKDAKAESLVLAAAQEDPNSSQPQLWLVGYYAETRQYDKAIDLLEKWVEAKPNDQAARKRLQDLKALAKIDSANANRPQGASNGE